MKKITDFDVDSFGKQLDRVLSASHAIDTPELLRGRTVQLDGIKQALFSSGRHVFIFGHRGVGKTSLARTAAFLLQSSDKEPVYVSCLPSTTCFEIVANIAKQATNVDPRLIKEAVNINGGLNVHFATASKTSSRELGGITQPKTLNEAISLLRLCVEKALRSNSRVLMSTDGFKVHMQAEL